MEKIKIAILGTGKTGQKVVELLQQKNLNHDLNNNFKNIYEIVAFNESNIPTQESLNGIKYAISFLPGEAFRSYIDLLVLMNISTIVGSTGISWPKTHELFDEELKQKNICWIHSSNFALGMQIVRKMIQEMTKAEELFDNDKINFSIHEIHHTKKLDAPSGTALMWEQWLRLKQNKVHITSERIGDVVGIHKLSLSTAYENITITHEAKDRKIFAEGAIWALEQIINKKIPNGLHELKDLII